MGEPASLSELHEVALTNWHSNRRGADERFIAAIDAIEAQISAEAFEAYRVAFPNCDAPKATSYPEGEPT